VSEKVYVAVESLCEGDRSFTERLESATVSALLRLNRDDAAPEIADDLDFVLKLSSDNMHDGRLVRELDSGERRQFVEALLRILVATEER
jgi:hypothetical protein